VLSNREFKKLKVENITNNELGIDEVVENLSVIQFYEWNRASKFVEDLTLSPSPHAGEGIVL
jgi:hypothetical protein